MTVECPDLKENCRPDYHHWADLVWPDYRKPKENVNIKFIPAKPLHNHDTISVHFNNFYCTEICHKLSRDLAMLTCIYLSVDDCRLTSSMP